MKRKIIQKNKKKYTERLKNKIYYMLTGDVSWHLAKTRYRYIEQHQVNEAYRRTSKSKMIYVPITYTSKVKRSRIRNVVVFYQCFSSIEQFNSKFNLDKKLEDIPAKRHYEA